MPFSELRDLIEQQTIIRCFILIVLPVSVAARSKA
jgi:hypothetical protein